MECPERADVILSRLCVEALEKEIVPISPSLLPPQIQVSRVCWGKLSRFQSTWDALELVGVTAEDRADLARVNVQRQATICTSVGVFGEIG